MQPNYCRHCHTAMVRTHTPANERVYECPNCLWACHATVAASAARHPRRVLHINRNVFRMDTMKMNVRTRLRGVWPALSIYRMYALDRMDGMGRKAVV